MTVLEVVKLVNMAIHRRNGEYVIVIRVEGNQQCLPLRYFVI